MIDGEKPAVVLESILIPVIVEATGDGGDGGRALVAVEVGTAQLEADEPLGLFLVSRKRLSEVRDASRIGVHGAFQALQRGGFACAIAPDEARDRAGTNREGHVLERERRVTFAKPPDFYQGRRILSHDLPFRVCR